MSRTDPKLFRDDVDIKFSRSLNSCKVPQVRRSVVMQLLSPYGSRASCLHRWGVVALCLVHLTVSRCREMEEHLWYPPQFIVSDEKLG